MNASDLGSKGHGGIMYAINSTLWAEARYSTRCLICVLF